MPLSPSLPTLGFVALTLVTSIACASEVETYTETATPTVNPAPPTEAATMQKPQSAAPSSASASASASSSGFFRWLRSSEAKAPVVEADAPRVDMPAVGLPSPLAAPLASSELVANALGMLGVNYRRGGNTPDSGFDCSGLVRYVFQSAIGLDLPRRAVEISKVGAKVGRNELKPGDLVFYNTLKSAFSHVGIYLGENRFIHAPSKGSQVRIEDMTQKYWTARFSGARRVAD